MFSARCHLSSFCFLTIIEHEHLWLSSVLQMVLTYLHTLPVRNTIAMRKPAIFWGGRWGKEKHRQLFLSSVRITVEDCARCLVTDWIIWDPCLSLNFNAFKSFLPNMVPKSPQFHQLKSIPCSSWQKKEKVLNIITMMLLLYLIKSNRSCTLLKLWSSTSQDLF